MQMLLKDGKFKVVTLSYDDGVIQDRRFMEICDRFGLKATFNINTALYGDDSWRLSRESAIKLYKNSEHEVAVHGYTHPSFDVLKAEEIVREVTEDRINLERDFGAIVRGCAYPYGTYSPEVIDVLKKCGIVYARTVNSTESFQLPKEWLAWHPTCHHANPALMELASKFLDAQYKFAPLMFYLWGHTYEFDTKDNWQVFEDFAQYISNRDDIWYATNIEIYDYVNAYYRLETDYNESIVHNPTATQVWFKTLKNTYCINGGETLAIE